MKTCTKCGLEKADTEFRKSKLGKNGLSASCKTCHASDAMQRTYGITIGDYDRMFVKQSGVCKICGTDNPGTNKGRFAIDHNHETGKVRGLLCYSCNVGIGHLKDDPFILLSAFKYLKNEEKGN